MPALDGATHRCDDCQADLLPEQVTRPSRAGRPAPLTRVHLVDTGPRRDQLAAHRIRRGARYGRPLPAAPVPPAATARALADAGPDLAGLPGAIIDTDVSEWQGRPYDASYTRLFARYRLTLGTTVTDKLGAANTAWCHANAGPGKRLIGHCGYHVWYPGNELAQASRFLAAAKLDPYFVAEIDVETWGGAIRGDHSASIMLLVNAVAAKLSRARVKVYGNPSDLAELFPHRPSWLGLVKATYSSQPPAEPWDGWQYTDGQTKWPVPAGWPRASAPFGACDHNAFYGNPAAFATAYGITPAAPKPPPIPKPPTPNQPPPQPLPLEEPDMLLILVDPKSVPTKGTWAGWFLQGNDLMLHHLTDTATKNSYQAKLPLVIITDASYRGFVAAGLLHAPVKAAARALARKVTRQQPPVPPPSDAELAELVAA